MIAGVGGLRAAGRDVRRSTGTRSAASAASIDAFGAVGVERETGIKAWESQGFTGTIANLVILAAALSRHRPGGR